MLSTGFVAMRPISAPGAGISAGAASSTTFTFATGCEGVGRASDDVLELTGPAAAREPGPEKTESLNYMPS